MTAVESKNSHRDDCTLKLRAIMGYAKIKWGGNSPQVRKFGAGDMTKADDKAFLTLCRMVLWCEWFSFGFDAGGADAADDRI